MGAPDLVILGNLLVDDIVRRDGSTLMGEAGGALLHAALAARLWGARVGLVSVVGTDYPAAALEALAERGVDLAGVRPLGRPGGRAWLLYERDVRRVIHQLDCPSHDDVSPLPADVPAVFRAARGFHLAPMPLDRQRSLAVALAAGGTSPPWSWSTESISGNAEGVPDRRPPPRAADRPFLSLDPFEFVRDDNLAEWSRVLAHVDAFFPSRDEVRVGAGPDDLVTRLAGGRLGLVALKAGAAGGRLVDLVAGTSHAWQGRAEDVVDATGAGDAFVGGFLAGALVHGDLPRAVEQGIVAASFAIEDWGARGLFAATPERVAARHAAWFGVAAPAGSASP
jgi:ribokinase